MPEQIPDADDGLRLSGEKPVRVYRGATVIDGTGGPRRVADVAVEGSHVVAVLSGDTASRLRLPEGAIEIDAGGLVLAPGFIDMSAHGDRATPDGAVRDGRARRGVTSEVLEQAGLVPAPVDDTTASVVPAPVTEWNGPVDVAFVVRHRDLRTAAIGLERRPATSDEIEAMAEMLGAAMDAGAFGMAGGLESDTGAGAAELEALCRVVAERGGHWAPHLRGDEGGIPAYREALDIARSAGCPVHFVHPAVDLGALTLEGAVRHLAGEPAAVLGLDRGDAPRGVIRDGATADLVLFDPVAIAAGALCDDPFARTAGVVETLVGGVPVVSGGVVTGATPGAALRMQPPAHRATVPRIDAAIDPMAPVFAWTPDTPVVAPEALAASASRLGGAASPDPAVPRITLLIDPTLADAPAAGGRVGAEAFRITVAASGVEIRGASPAGVFRGATALRQLREPGADCARIPAGVWEGSPAHAWRGVMLDVARHFRPADDLRRLIDLLADHHLNVLHLHLTDDQGWRFEVPGYPRLTEVGARREATQYGHGPLATVEPGVHEGHYTDVELRDLVAFAAERFVTIVPEVELPGHIQAGLAAYPELGNRDVGEPASSAWERFGVNPRTLAPTEASLTFGRAAIDALCALFDSEWIGIGGDEVPVTEWEQSAAAGERMRELGLATPFDVQPWFTAQFAAHVRSRGRTALAWDEVLEGDVPEGVQVLAWRGPAAMREALRRGIPVVACPDLEAYLDYPQSESAEEPIRVGPPLTIERAYTFRVEEGAAGGQANVWTEHLPTRDRADFAMFPRLAAIAERLWEGGDPAPFEDFARRLPVHLRRLTEAGVRYRPLDGPTPQQRRLGVPGKPLTIEEREAIVAGLVARLVERAGASAGPRPPQK